MVDRTIIIDQSAVKCSRIETTTVDQCLELYVIEIYLACGVVPYGVHSQHRFR